MITNLSEAAFHKVHKDYLDAAIEKIELFLKGVWGLSSVRGQGSSQLLLTAV